MSHYNSIRRVAMLSFAALYITNLYVKNRALSLVGSILLVLVVLLTLPVLGKVNRIVCIMLLLFGSGILLKEKVPIETWLDTFSWNAGLAALFITIPMLSIPLFYENYHEELRLFVHKYVRSSLSFYFITMVMTHIFGLVIMIGSIPLMYELFHENAKLYHAEGQFISALVHGQISAGFWSPVWSSMIIITYNLHVPWIRFVPFGILFSLLFFLLCMTWCWFSTKHTDVHQIELDKTITTNWGALLKIGGLTILPIILIILLNSTSGFSIMSVIPIVSFFYPLLMALVQNKWQAYGHEMARYVNTRILDVKNEVALLTLAGFFGKSLEIAEMQNAIVYLLPKSALEYPYIAILSLMLIFVLTAHLGLHPVIAGSALVVAIRPEMIGLSTFMFGFSLIVGWALGILLSPFSATNMLAGSIAHRSSWYFSMRRHGFLGLSAICIFSALLALLARFY